MDKYAKYQAWLHMTTHLKDQHVGFNGIYLWGCILQLTECTSYWEKKPQKDVTGPYSHCCTCPILATVETSQCKPWDTQDVWAACVRGQTELLHSGVCLFTHSVSLQPAAPLWHHSPTLFLHNFPFDKYHNHIIFRYKCHLYLVWLLGKLTWS